MKTGKSGKELANKVMSFYMPLFFCIAFIIFPFYWTINTSLKSEADILKIPPEYFPSEVTFNNFIMAWKAMGFSIFFRNSLMIASVSVIFITLSAVLVGYALSRFKFRGKQLFILILLCTQFIPGAMLIIPIFIIFKTMGIINNMLSLVFIYSAFQLPFNSIIMKGFVSSIPPQLEEAAMVDGCNMLQAIRYAILPILIPGIIATSTFAFVGCWNEFLYALMLTNKRTLFTIPVGLRYMMGEFSINYGALAAGSIIAIIPAIIMFSYIQKYLVNGLSAGALKG